MVTVPKWPTLQDYQERVQYPHLAFQDPLLRQCKVDVDDKFGLPRFCAGNFAAVVRLYNGQTSVAVRLFVKNVDGRKARYERIDAHLRQAKQVALRKGLCYPLVDFQYLEKGICVGGKWWPLVRLEWVNGQTLYKWLQDRVKKADASAIQAIAEQWVQVVNSLREMRICHGDLQHGNIMVTESGKIVLVDYDCMGVPGLFGEPAPEAGLPAYQHPDRKKCQVLLTENLDDFSALLITVALRAIAYDLSLWKKFVENRANENILFTEQDLSAPDASDLFRQLQRLADPQIQTLTKVLVEALRKPLNKCPSWHTIWDPYYEMRRLIVGGQWKPGQLAELVSRCPSPVPSDIADWIVVDQLAAQIIRYGSSRNFSVSSILSVSQSPHLHRLRKISAYNSVVKTWDRLYALAGKYEKLCAVVKESLRKLESRELTKMWEATAKDLCALEEYDVLKRAVESAVAFCATTVELQSLLSRVPVSLRKAKDLLAQWNRLMAQLSSMPVINASANCLNLKNSFQRIADLVKVYEDLLESTNAMNEDSDRRALHFWINRSDELKATSEYDQLKARVDEVKARLEKIDAIYSAISTPSNWPSIRQHICALPSNYRFRRERQVHSVREALEIHRELVEVLAQTLTGPTPNDDGRAVQLFARLERSGGRMLVNPHELSCVESSRRRLGLLAAWRDYVPNKASWQALQRFAGSLGDQTQLDEVIPASVASKEYRNVRDDARKAYELLEAAKNAEVAVAGPTKDEVYRRLVRLVDKHPCLIELVRMEGYPLSQTLLDALSIVKEAHQILRRIMEDPIEAFGSIDPKFIAKYANLFQEVKDELGKAARQLAMNVVRDVKLYKNPRGYPEVTWKWDLCKACSECEIKYVQDGKCFTLRVTDEDFQIGMQRVPLPANHVENCCVRAVIDFGIGKVFGPGVPARSK